MSYVYGTENYSLVVMPSNDTHHYSESGRFLVSGDVDKPFGECVVDKTWNYVYNGNPSPYLGYVRCVWSSDHWLRYAYVNKFPSPPSPATPQPVALSPSKQVISDTDISFADYNTYSSWWWSIVCVLRGTGVACLVPSQTSYFTSLSGRFAAVSMASTPQRYTSLALALDPPGSGLVVYYPSPTSPANDLVSNLSDSSGILPGRFTNCITSTGHGLVFGVNMTGHLILWRSNTYHWHTNVQYYKYDMGYIGTNVTNMACGSPNGLRPTLAVRFSNGTVKALTSWDPCGMAFSGPPLCSVPTVWRGVGYDVPPRCNVTHDWMCRWEDFSQLKCHPGFVAHSGLGPGETQVPSLFTTNFTCTCTSYLWEPPLPKPRCVPLCYVPAPYNTTPYTVTPSACSDPARGCSIYQLRISCGNGTGLAKEFIQCSPPSTIGGPIRPFTVTKAVCDVECLLPGGPEAWDHWSLHPACRLGECSLRQLQSSYLCDPNVSAPNSSFPNYDSTTSSTQYPVTLPGRSVARTITCPSHGAEFQGAYNETCVEGCFIPRAYGGWGCYAFGPNRNWVGYTTIVPKWVFDMPWAGDPRTRFSRCAQNFCYIDVSNATCPYPGGTWEGITGSCYYWCLLPDPFLDPAYDFSPVCRNATHALPCTVPELRSRSGCAPWAFGIISTRCSGCSYNTYFTFITGNCVGVCPEGDVLFETNWTCRSGSPPRKPPTQVPTKVPPHIP